MPADRKIGPGPSGVINVAIQAADDLNRFVDICLAGVGFSRQAKRIVTLKHTLKNEEEQAETEARYQEHLKQAAELETFLEVHCKSGFPYLYCLVSLRLWSVLETLIKDLAQEMLIAFSELQSNDTLRALKGPLLPFLASSPSEQATVILKLLEKDLSGPQYQIGIARFELLLEQFGMGGGVDPLVKRTLLELWAVRNVVAHKNGVADSRFIEVCPWFAATVGAQLPVSPLDFSRYRVASIWYIAEISRRLHVGYPKHASGDEVPVSELEEILQTSLQTLQGLADQRSAREV
jgi:hypothetical protein